jgi:hypothetical protein
MDIKMMYRAVTFVECAFGNSGMEDRDCILSRGV